MTKFDEMCAAFEQSRNSYFDYQRQCFSSMVKLVNGFNDYCKIPTEQIKYVPVNKKTEEGALYSVIGAMHLDKDTFWHIGLQISLHASPNSIQQQQILIVLCLKELEGKTIVRIGLNAEPQSLDLSDKMQCEIFYERIVQLVKDNFQKGLQYFLEKSSPLRKIGF